ncbi:hypothetical protein Vadar_013200 [Vaccinium darrowii]|uniref:Uncharacterized protein n=1 Tax=Vaccinium darrowii TaxID=229202 RepID=A0ACB7ZBE7_9ERIC|nr:hypothetical protein Vadar_013200 [Vaccinium darrowii]
MEQWSGKGSKGSAHWNYSRNGTDAKWAFLFKRPMKSRLVELNNRKWVRREDPGGGTSYNRDSPNDVGGTYRQSNDGEGFERFSRSTEKLIDESEVCVISDRSTQSFTSSFSFLDEGVSCPISNRWLVLDDSLLDDRGKIRMEPVSKGECVRSLEGERCEGGDDFLGSGSEEGGTGRAFRGCYTESEEGAAVSMGLEMVAYSREEESESLRPGCQHDEEMVRHLGWVQDIVDDGLIGNSVLHTPLAVREPDLLWDDGDKLTSGMPQEEVSKWVLKRVSGFGKFLGVSFDGYEDRTMKLFADIEEKWRKGTASDIKRGGNKTNKGERELKRLQCSINYEGSKRGGERGNGEVVKETKLSEVSREGAKEIWGNRWAEWVHLDAVGAAGGVWVLWDSRVVEKIEEEYGLFSVSCLFKNVMDGFQWVFTGVYGPVIDRHRGDLWDELSAMAYRWDAPWCVGGDFNVVRFPYERLGCNAVSRNMRRFSDFINEVGLVDPPLSGSNFTWFGDHGNRCMSRIDRFLFSTSWEEHFSNVAQFSLPRPISDHTPILLDSGGIRHGRTPFRFENMWLLTEGFTERVGEWWKSYLVAGKSSFILAKKLNLLKRDLRIWNSETFGRLEVQKAKVVDVIRHWDLEEQARALREEDRLLRDNAKEEFGDRVLTKDEEISSGIADFYESLFREEEVFRPRVDGTDFDSISGEDASWLERPFDEAEVVAALKALNGDKAPGPDGLTTCRTESKLKGVLDMSMSQTAGTLVREADQLVGAS